MPEAVLKLVASSPIYAIGEWQGHTLVTWQGPASLQSARELARSVERMTTASPGRACILVLIGPSTGLPDAEIRSLFVDLGRKVSPALNCIGVTIEGSGFAVAALRGAVTGLSLAMGRGVTMRSHATLAEMAAWVRPRLVAAGASFGPDSEVLAVFASLLAALRPGSAPGSLR